MPSEAKGNAGQMGRRERKVRARELARKVAHPVVFPHARLPEWAHEVCDVAGCMRCEVRDDYRGND